MAIDIKRHVEVSVDAAPGAIGATCSDSRLCLGLRWLPFISSWEGKRRLSWKMQQMPIEFESGQAPDLM